jgi:hypothetical protein
MSALIKDRNTPYREGDQYAIGVKGGARIFAGSIVCRDADGYAVPASDSAGLKVMGRAEFNVDNTAGADGAVIVLVREGVYRFSGSGLTAADAGKPCFIVDDQTVSVAPTANSVLAGIVVDVESAAEPWVEMGITIRAGKAQADSAAADVAGLVADFNALLGNLRAARLIAG